MGGKMSKEYHRQYYLENKSEQLAKQKQKRDNWTPEQKAAAREYQKQYREKNRERLLKYDAERNAERYAALSAEEKAKDLARQRMARATNKEHFKEKNARYRQYRRVRLAARRALLLNATPAWADSGDTQRVYELADYMQRIDGVVRHVDHIIPLCGKNVCGLHVANNLRVATAEENRRKGNRHEV